MKELNQRCANHTNKNDLGQTLRRFVKRNINITNMEFILYIFILDYRKPVYHSWYSDYATGCRVRGSNPGKCKGTLYSLKRQDGPSGPTQPPIQRAPGFFHGVQPPGCEVNHTPHLAKVKNECSCNSITPTCLHGVDRKTLAFY